MTPDHPPIIGLRKNGEEFPTEATVSKLDVDGTRLFTIVLRDATESKRVEREQKVLAEAGAALSSSLERDEILARLSGLCTHEIADVFVVDVPEAEGWPPVIKVQTCDPAKRRFCDVVEARGRTGFFASLPEARSPALMTELPPGYLESVARDGEELEALRALDLRSAIAAPVLAGDRVVGAIFLGSFRSTFRYGPRDLFLAEELARRVATALENARLYELAKLAKRARDNVLGIVAHDLRNPVTTILMQAELLRRRDGDPEHVQAATDAIDTAAKRTMRLIQDLLDVRRMETGRLSIDCRPTAVGEIVCGAVEMVRGSAQNASIALETDMDGGVPDVWADRDRVLQLLDNLLSNAIKFTGRGGRVVVTAAPQGAEVLFRVTDSGVGIEPEDVPHLFDPFWQARKGDRRGAGLGLQIVKAIAESHHGHVWVESTPKRGSTFSFTIPTAASTEDRRRATAGE
jgi:signal transduction histidine kinase